MEPVELKAICILPDGSELIKTGIYVFENTTIAQIRELFAKGITTPVGTHLVSKVEIQMEDKE